MEKEEFFLKRIRELANISYQRDIVAFSDFLDLNEQNLLHTFMRSSDTKLAGVIIECFGGHIHAERQMAAFYPTDLSYSPEYPIDCLIIKPKSQKFSEDLSHRDYLGALMNLGVERSMVGDIVVQDHTAWMFCCQKMTEFFIENLHRVRHTDIFISKATNPMELPEPNLKLITGTCASVRLDSLIALAFQSSRNNIVSCIEKGTVFVNGRLVTSNGYKPKEGALISVRGKGRFRYDGTNGTSKKGRIGVRIFKYI